MIVAGAVIAAAGCVADDRDPLPVIDAQAESAPRQEPVRGTIARPFGLAPVGDVDGDGVPDASASSDKKGPAPWLVLSRGGGRLAGIVGHYPNGALPHEAEAMPLGDVDEDGRDDIAIASEAGHLVVLYGRDRWPARVALDSRGTAKAAGRVRGSERAGWPQLATVSRGRLIVGSRCEEGCASGVRRLRVPRRGEALRVADGAVLPRPDPGRGRTLFVPTGPWAAGPRPVTGWFVHGRGVPEGSDTAVTRAGRPTWLLPPVGQLFGATTDAVLVTRPWLPGGQGAVEEQLVVYGIGANGAATATAITTLDSGNRAGTLAAVGRCVLAASWKLDDVTDETPAVWAIELPTMRAIHRWRFPGARVAIGQASGRDVHFTVARANGTLARAQARLPSGC